MKKIFLCLLLAVCAVFCSCERALSMNELLKYQENDFRAEVRINGDISAVIEKEGDTVSVTLLSPDDTAGVIYLSENGELYLCYEGMKIKVEKSALFSASLWIDAMSLSPSGTWKITKESPAGANVYKCVSDDVTVYIDRAELYPVRIETGDDSIDIISFKVIKRTAAE